jgi:hypothetical protein
MKRLWWLLLLSWTGAVQAHIASNGFLVARVQGQEITGSLELAVRDVELAIGVDANHDGRVTWGELRTSEPQVLQYVGQHLAFLAQDGACTVHLGALQINDRVDGSYAWVPLSAHCPGVVKRLSIRYSLMADIDPSHRGLLTLSAGELAQSGVLGGASNPDFQVYSPSAWRTLLDYLQAGIWHIWSGIDHLLFLISLLLPAVLVRRGTRWEPVLAARPAVFSILKVVTAFTLAHSLTLTLAALNVVRLPSRLTESVIAASIIVATEQYLSGRHRQPRAHCLCLRAASRLRFCIGAGRHGIALGRPATVPAVIQSRHRNRAARRGPGRHARCLRHTRKPGLSPRSTAMGVCGHRRDRTRMAAATCAAAHGLNRRLADVDSRTRCRRRGLWRLPVSDRVCGRARCWP